MHTISLPHGRSLPRDTSLPLGEAGFNPKASERSALLRRTLPVLHTVNDRTIPSGSDFNKYSLDPEAIVRSRVASEVAQLVLVAGGLTTGQNRLSPDNISLRLAEEESQVNTMTVMSEAGSKLVIAAITGFGLSPLSGPFAKEDIVLPTGKEQNIVKGLAEHQETLNQAHNFERPPFEFEAYQAAYLKLINQNQ